MRGGIEGRLFPDSAERCDRSIQGKKRGDISDLSPVERRTPCVALATGLTLAAGEAAGRALFMFVLPVLAGLTRLVEGWPWWAKAHVALTGQLLLLVEVVAAVHERAGALMIKHVLPWKPPSEMGVNVNVFGLWMRLLLVMLGEVGWRGAHHPWWRLHLGPQRRGAVRHVWGDEGLQGLLGQWAPMLLEGRRSSWTGRVVLLGLQLLLMRLMRRRHSRGWLLIGKRWGNGEEGKPKQPLDYSSILTPQIPPGLTNVNKDPERHQRECTVNRRVRKRRGGGLYLSAAVIGRHTRLLFAIGASRGSALSPGVQEECTILKAACTSTKKGEGFVLRQMVAHCRELVVD
ncbi:hypothetical protein INR49_014885 [Caranx melampygus]|nr:hypothetical protein INR49_014885 [Caranx melampygus]